MNKVIIAILFLLFTAPSFSCDYCNCYLGLNPHYKKNNIGVRYHLMNYEGTHESESELNERNLSKSDFRETRTSVELHGQWYAGQKLKLIFSLPYAINTESINNRVPSSAQHNHIHNGTGDSENPGSETIKGIGDPLVIAHYQLFNRTGDSLHFDKRLLAGGGIKFPFGKWRLEENAEANERVHQPGTGSWDFILSAEFIAKYKRVGLNVNSSYLITSSNEQSFRFANRFNANVIFYYLVKKNIASFYPNLGIYFEQAGKDIDNKATVINSGGTILYAHAGLDFYFRNFSINAAFQIPPVQHLNEPQPQLKYRCIIGIAYAFN